MREVREKGYYWVKVDATENARWVIMEWSGLFFYDTYNDCHEASQLTINEERIKTPDEK